MAGPVKVTDPLAERCYTLLVNELGALLKAKDCRIHSLLASAGCELPGDDSLLLFTLPELFRGLCSSLRIQEADRTDFVRFRYLLYNSPTQQRLRIQGLCVEPHSPHRNADQRRYRLVVRDKSSRQPDRSRRSMPSDGG